MGWGCGGEGGVLGLGARGYGFFGGGRRRRRTLLVCTEEVGDDAEEGDEGVKVGFFAVEEGVGFGRFEGRVVG